ncbi:unnamed protein product [Paramecium octaurelia]|uniref:Uncharacterized protein n=1 Tax=Paramecium octaurelia TaxID=43137 RepID=A0A8S1XSA1_PAROT|nr:unnamed protein product [Paramecium octaurelia]
MEERGLRSNEKVTKQLDYQTRKMVSPQTDVNLKKENSNPLDQNNSTYSLKGYERQAPYSSNQFEQSRQTGEQQKITSNNNPYLKQSLYNNPEPGKPFIRTYQEGDLRKPLDQANFKQELRQINEREITSPYVNLENQKRDPIGTRTPIDPRANMSAYTPQSRQDLYRRDVQQSDYKREFQLPEYKRMYPVQDSRIPPRQINSFEMQQKPVDQQGDRMRYDQERIRTLGGQQEQPERMDRMIRASDYVRKSDNQDFLEQDKRPLERREYMERGGAEQGQHEQRNNTSKSQEYSQRSQNQVRKYQEGSKTPIEGRMIERRGFDDHMQLQGRPYQQPNPQNPYLEGGKQQFYEAKPPLDEQRRMANPYEERRNLNPYETRPQFLDQRPPYERRPDRPDLERRPDHPDFERRPVQHEFDRRPDFERRPDRPDFERRIDRPEFERRPDRPEFDRRPDRPEFDRRPDRPEFERRPDRPEFEKRPDIEGRSPYQARFGPEGRFDADQRLPPDFKYRQQGHNNERFQQQGIRQGVEGIQAQRVQFEERPPYGQGGLQDERQGMNYRKYSDGRAILDGRVENRDAVEGRPAQQEGKQYQIDGRVLEGKQYQVDGRAGFNRTYGEDRYQGATIFEGRPGLEGRREQFCIRPPIQGRTFEERANVEQRVPIESRNQFQRAYDDKFGDKYFEQKYPQQQDPIGRKDLGRPETGKLREEFDRRTTYGRPDIDDKMAEFGKRKEVDGRVRPETSFGRPNGIGQQPGERYYRRDYNDQEQRLSYHQDTSVIDRLGLERGTNRNIIGNQAAENMLRGGQTMSRQYDRERSYNRLGMGERVASFTNSKMGYQRTAVQDKEEYQGYVRSKLMPKSLGNGASEFQRKQSQDQGFQKLQSPKAQIETRVGIYDIQRRDGRI